MPDLSRIDFGTAPNTFSGDNGGAAITKLDNNTDLIESYGFKRVKAYGWDHPTTGVMTAIQDASYFNKDVKEVKYIFLHPFSVSSGNNYSKNKYIKPTEKASVFFGLSAAVGNVDLSIKVQSKAEVTVTSGTLGIGSTMTRNIRRVSSKFKPYIYVDKGTGKGRMQIEVELINPSTLATAWTTIEIHNLNDGEAVRSVKHLLPMPSALLGNGRGGMLYGYRYRITALDVALEHDNYGAGVDGTLTTVYSQTVNPSTDLVGGFIRVDIDEDEFNYVELAVNYNAVNVTVNKTFLKTR
jgi:hypothetical protein